MSWFLLLWKWLGPPLVPPGAVDVLELESQIVEVAEFESEI